MHAIRTDGTAVRFVTDDPEPELGPGEVLVRITLAAITPADLMAARAGSGFAGVLGHCAVGVIEDGDPDLPADPLSNLCGTRVVVNPIVSCGSCPLCKSGLASNCQSRRVLGLDGAGGCFAQRVAVPRGNVVPIPAELPDEAAVFAARAALAMHAAQRIRIEGKPYITVLGDGVLGLIAAQVLAKLNASVRLLGSEPKRFLLCEKWGIKHRHASEVGQRADQDVVVVTDADRLELACGLVRPRGKVVLLGPELFGDFDVRSIVRQELEVVGIASGDIGAGLDALATGGIDALGLIARKARLSEGPNALQLAAEPDQLAVLLDAA